MSLPDWNAADLAVAAPYLDEWTATYAIDRALVYGLVSQESSFQVNAYRAEPQINDASYGLTQILYATAQGLGYPGTPDGLFDPSTNVQYGLLLLRDLLDTYNGDVTSALSSYNSGSPTGSLTYAGQVATRAAYFAALFAGQDPATAVDSSGTSSDAADGLSGMQTALLVVGGIALALAAMKRWLS